MPREFRDDDRPDRILHTPMDGLLLFLFLTRFELLPTGVLVPLSVN